MKTEAELNDAIERYADMVRRVCFLYLKNEADTEDIMQNVFLKYLLHSAEFETEEHKKAWLLRVAMNESKDLLKSFFRSRTGSLDEIMEQASPAVEEAGELLPLVLALPTKYKEAIYLHYYEGYNAVEIGQMLNKAPNTIYSLLARGRERLKKQMQGGAYESI